tara:strand:+ start:396 stop:500 length:105 start_codon:yes stop_codon:yes gene_type:complete
MDRNPTEFEALLIIMVGSVVITVVLNAVVYAFIG